MDEYDDCDADIKLMDEYDDGADATWMNKYDDA